ncbi:hypothetical protein F5B22DRAFT_649715 [Xylaria bambusicola]|uniref:uncharacterized protein n=1 Tax=Xylaria bambusicola TaxID=326684 RepID=UPI0020086871|nr:uncharacterized protein F5B22DRAFT_649715 [Xylaria bambusicola]KAI0508818.1 hypothetical protein F5B22DRAFT_649715 [Xylaria bambusicola]
MLSLLVISLTFLAHLGAGAPAPDLLGLPIGPLLPPNATGPLAPVISLLANLGNGDPPKILWTPNPSPECAKEVGGNGGELQCCRVTIAGDLPIVVFLAEIYGYNLNPNDVNGVICEFFPVFFLIISFLGFLSAWTYGLPPAHETPIAFWLLESSSG